MRAPDPDFRARIRETFAHAAFVQELGIELMDCDRGWCETRMDIEPRHLQQSDVVHAGVQTTIADHTAAAACITVLPAGHGVLSVEFKLNLLRPARGRSLRCRGELLKPGKNLSIGEAWVWCLDEDGEETLVSKLTLTLAVVPDPPAQKSTSSE